MHLSRLLSTVAMAFLAIACNSQAQQPGAALHEVEDLGLMVQPLNLSVEDIEEDADLLDQAGEEVGAMSRCWQTVADNLLRLRLRSAASLAQTRRRW